MFINAIIIIYKLIQSHYQIYHVPYAYVILEHIDRGMHQDRAGVLLYVRSMYAYHSGVPIAGTCADDDTGAYDDAAADDTRTEAAVDDDAGAYADDAVGTYADAEADDDTRTEAADDDDAGAYADDAADDDTRTEAADDDDAGAYADDAADDDDDAGAYADDAADDADVGVGVYAGGSSVGTTSPGTAVLNTGCTIITSERAIRSGVIDIIRCCFKYRNCSGISINAVNANRASRDATGTDIIKL